MSTPATPRIFAAGLAAAALAAFVFADARAVHGAPPAQSATPLKVAIAVSVGKDSLVKFQKHLESHYRAECGFVEADKGKSFKDLKPLEGCDVILSSLYRTEATPEQLEVLKKYFLSKPVVGLRRAHHGFQNWLEADMAVFGVDYRGHYFGPNVTLRIVDKHAGDPMLRGVKPFLPDGGLYQHVDADGDVEVLMVGGPQGKPPLPQTWMRVNRKTGQRVFYTRYDPRNLADEGVRDMVVRALFWAAGREPDRYKR